MPKFVSNSYAHVISFTASMKAQHNFCYRHCNCGLELGTCFFKKLVLIQVLAVFWMWIFYQLRLCVPIQVKKRLVGPVLWVLKKERFQAFGDASGDINSHLIGQHSFAEKKKSHKILQFLKKEN